MKKISVVIPTYKRPDLLIKCLKHLEQQTLPKEDFEVLVVSDGFDETTEQLLADYSKGSAMTILYKFTDGKKGPATARNIGWENAVAPLIAFTDDDCQPDPKWLSSFLEHYRNETYLVFSGFTVVPLPPYPSDFALNTAHLQDAAFITANCACTKAALQEVQGFDERYKAAWREDSDLEFKFYYSNIPIIKLPDAIVVHPVRQDIPWGISIKEQKKSLYNALLYEKFPVLYKQRIQRRPPLNYYFIVLLLALSIIFMLAELWYPALASTILLFIMLLKFFFKRIKPLKKTKENIWEMLVTSIVIPFVSVYWRIYGAINFRVFFI